MRVIIFKVIDSILWIPKRLANIPFGLHNTVLRMPLLGALGWIMTRV